MPNAQEEFLRDHPELAQKNPEKFKQYGIKVPKAKINSSVDSPPTQDTKKKSNFQSNFGNIPDGFNDNLEWKNEDGTDHWMANVFLNSINGQYKYTVDKYAQDQEWSKDAFNKLGEANWELSAYVKSNAERHRSGQMSNHDRNVFETKVQEKRDAIQALAYDALGSISKGKRTMGGTESLYDLTDDQKFLFYDENTGKLKSKKKHIEDSQGFFISSNDNDFGTNISVEDTGMSVSEYSDKWFDADANARGSYTAMLVNERLNKRARDKDHKSLVSSYVNHSFNKWLGTPGGEEVASVENRQRSTKISMSIINYGAKYGFANDEGGKMKKEAKNLLKQMNDLKAGGESGYKKEQKFVAEHMDNIRNMTDNLGSWGNKAMFNKYFEEFNDPSYYPGEGDAQREHYKNNYNRLKRSIVNEAQFDTKIEKLRSKAKSRLMADIGDTNVSGEERRQDRMIADFLFDDTEHLRSWEKVKGLLTKNYGSEVDRNGVRQFNDPNVTLEENISGGAAMASHGGLRYSYSQIKEAYSRVANKFKEQFGDMTMNEAFGQLGSKTGIGFKVSQFVEQRSVNLNSDGRKADNLRTIMKLVEDRSWKTNNGKVYITPGGLDHSVTEDELNEVSSLEQKKMFDRIFSGAIKDDNLYDVAFSRHTALKGKSAYIVTIKNPNPKKKAAIMTMYIDRSLANSAGEDFAKHTFTSANDWVYKQSGEWDLKYLDGEYSSGLKIVEGSSPEEAGYKVLIGKIYDDVAKQPVPKRIILGPSQMLTISEAQKLTERELNKAIDAIKAKKTQ